MPFSTLREGTSRLIKGIQPRQPVPTGLSELKDFHFLIQETSWKKQRESRGSLAELPGRCPTGPSTAVLHTRLPAPHVPHPSLQKQLSKLFS